MKKWWYGWSDSENEERARIRVATRAATTKAEAQHWVSLIRRHLDSLEEALRDLPTENRLEETDE